MGHLKAHLFGQGENINCEEEESHLREKGRDNSGETICHPQGESLSTSISVP